MLTLLELHISSLLFSVNIIYGQDILVWKVLVGWGEIDEV